MTSGTETTDRDERDAPAREIHRCDDSALSPSLSNSKHIHRGNYSFACGSLDISSPLPFIPFIPSHPTLHDIREREVVFTVDTASHPQHTARAGAVSRRQSRTGANVPDRRGSTASQHFPGSLACRESTPHPISQPATATISSPDDRRRRRNPPTYARPPSRQTQRAYSPRQTRQTRPSKRYPQ